MCDPIALAATTGVAGAVKAFGALDAGNAAAKAAEANADAINNAEIGTVQATNQKVRNEQIRDGQIQGAQLAGQAAGNVALGSGSAAEIRTDAQQTGQTATSNILLNGYQTVQQLSAQQAGLRTQASTDVSSGELNAAGSILGTAASVGDSYMRFQSPSSLYPSGPAGAI